jgi:hypothetical protein
MTSARAASRMLVRVVAATALAAWALSCGARVAPEAVEAKPVPPPPKAAAVVTAPEATAAAPVVKLHHPEWTSCRELAHVGDSTSLGLVSKQLLPNVDDRIGARYHAVGVERFWPEISGARSMVEKYKDQPNATEIVRRRRASGYDGCYVLALGTNDPANTSGNVAMLSARIDAMMAQIGDTPVLWTTTKTLKHDGPYQNANMAHWNRAVIDACARHANMRVYDWASEVQDDWFTRDGIHFNSVGYRERAVRFAKALARAFPKDGTPTHECVVHATE